MVAPDAPGMTNPVALVIQIPVRRLSTDRTLRFESVRSLLDASRHLARLPYDAVIAPLSTGFQSLAGEILERDGGSPYAPILLAVANDPVCVAPFDACLPVDAVATVLPTLLRMRQQRIASHERYVSALEMLEQTQQLSRQRPETEVELLKNAIVRNVSHELKTPLLHVKSAVALLKEGDNDESRHAELVEYASSATSRLENIVSNITMLSYSLNVNPGPILLRDVVEAALRNLRRAWESRDHTERIHIEIPALLPPISADKQALITVMQLLIDNALKFSTKEVEVRACPNTDNSQVEVSVQDYGIGIAQERLAEIFEPFIQLDRESTRKVGGTGIGLSLVRLILEYHNATIHVDSRLERGSTFSFSLPIVAAWPGLPRDKRRSQNRTD